MIPRALELRELAHAKLTTLHVVGSMHERKAKMAELAHGFIALPGGMGTLEEFAEILTWAQLGLHARPCGLLDVAGYYQPLIAFFDRAVAEGFVRPEHRELMVVADDPGRAPRPVRILATARRSSGGSTPARAEFTRGGGPRGRARRAPLRRGDTGRCAPARLAAPGGRPPRPPARAASEITAGIRGRAARDGSAARSSLSRVPGTCTRRTPMLAILAAVMLAAAPQHDTVFTADGGRVARDGRRGGTARRSRSSSPTGRSATSRAATSFGSSTRTARSQAGGAGLAPPPPPPAPAPAPRYAPPPAYAPPPPPQAYPPPPPAHTLRLTCPPRPPPAWRSRVPDRPDLALLPRVRAGRFVPVRRGGAGGRVRDAFGPS